MFAFRSRRRPLGFTLVEVLAVSGLISGLSAQGDFRYAINAANETKGLSNLKQIYTLLQMQAMTEKLPAAAFYPQGDPKKDPKSILNLIKDAPAELFVSPFAPDGLKKKGLTFAWNDAVNGKELDTLPRDTWLLIDLAAFAADPKVSKPDKYLILYADGRAVSAGTLPPDIVKAVKEAQARAESPGK